MDESDHNLSSKGSATNLPTSTDPKSWNVMNCIVNGLSKHGKVGALAATLKQLWHSAIIREFMVLKKRKFDIVIAAFV